MGYRYPEREAAWRAANAEWVKEYRKAWYERNKQKSIDNAAKWAKANPEKEKARLALYRKQNPEKCAQRVTASKKKNLARVAEYNANWIRVNADKMNSYKARRKACKLSAMPVWANRSLILEVYALARSRSAETGIAHHTDHIVPLQSKVVCGLHCEANLRVISSRENQSKGNRVWPDMP